MKKYLPLLSVLLFSQLVIADNPDEQALRELKTELWNKAYRTQDAGLLGQILHPRFQMINAQGKITTRSDELKWVSENAWNPVNFNYEIERLEIYGDNFAIVSGNGSTDTYEYKSSNVLIKEDGQWRAVSSHVSGYKEK